jgi:hypothetical protein
MPAEVIMGQDELREFIEATRAVRLANTASPEAAREFLIREGLLTPEGKLPEQYIATEPSK